MAIFSEMYYVERTVFYLERDQNQSVIFNFYFCNLYCPLIFKLLNVNSLINDDIPNNSILRILNVYKSFLIIILN